MIDQHPKRPLSLVSINAGTSDPSSTQMLADRIADRTVTIGAEEAPAVLKLMEQLEDHDDVQNVYANFDIPAEVMETIEA